MSRLLLTDEPPTPYCPHCGQPMKLVGISRLLGRSCPTLLELYCASCDHEEIKEDRVRMGRAPVNNTLDVVTGAAFDVAPQL